MLDILDGVAVHAVRGIRQDYKPIKSVLCGSYLPLDLASTFENLGFTELYVADLDAILGKNRGLYAIKQIASRSKMKLVVDAGVSDVSVARELLQNGASRVIIGTETLSRTAFVGEAIRSLGSERVLVSLDLKNGTFLGRFKNSPRLNSVELLEGFRDEGLTQVLILDLAKVGSGEGVNVAFLRQFLGVSDLRVFVGGGVRSTTDLIELEELGVSGVLVATALHSGLLSPRDLVEAGLEL